MINLLTVSKSNPPIRSDLNRNVHSFHKLYSQQSVDWVSLGVQLKRWNIMETLF